MTRTDWQVGAVADYWDAVAPRYLELFRDEFRGKPFDQDVIKTFAAGLGAGAQVVDAGCGPCGAVARLLTDAGAEVVGVDISPVCIKLAREVEPSLRFEVMDIAAMAFADGAFDGVVAYYALHYQPVASLGGVMAEFARVLRPGGRMLLVAKDGEDEGWIADPMGVVEWVYWCSVGAEALQALLRDNGFDVVRCEVREAMAQEIAVGRIYITAERVGW